MAFGIDDALMTAAASISLGDTMVKTVQSYRRNSTPKDLEDLLDEVRQEGRNRIDDAINALNDLERTLEQDKDIRTNQPLRKIINDTSWWQPYQQYRMRRIGRAFQMLSLATQDAIHDIAAFARCQDKTTQMGGAVVDSNAAKQELHLRLLRTETLKGQIDILREELTRQRRVLE